MQKSYVIDTNVLIEDEKSIEILRNGEENYIYITRTILEELDKLKDKKPHLKSRIFSIINELEMHKDEVEILQLQEEREEYNNKDNKIIDEILENIELLNIKDPVLVTNDNILRFKAYKKNIKVEKYKRLTPFKQESEEYTGFSEFNNKINNSFYWSDGKLYFHSNDHEHMMNYENSPWKIRPINHYQNCFIDLMMNDNIDLVTVQSDPGKGKSYLAIATALYQVFEKKKYDKIYVVKSNYEIGNGNDMGYLPGNVNEKIWPYFKPMHNLILKLSKVRKIPQKALDEKNEFGLNSEYIEFVPINYLRGMNLENAFVIVEEIQNLSRTDARSLLSRMGEGVKCVCTGDISQIDSPYVDKNNNAMNWIVKCFKGQTNYAHIVLKGKNTRGPICKLVIERGL